MIVFEQNPSAASETRWQREEDRTGGRKQGQTLPSGRVSFTGIRIKLQGSLCSSFSLRLSFFSSSFSLQLAFYLTSFCIFLCLLFTRFGILCSLSLSVFHVKRLECRRRAVKNRARNDLLIWLGLLSVTPTIQTWIRLRQLGRLYRL